MKTFTRTIQVAMVLLLFFFEWRSAFSSEFGSEDQDGQSLADQTAEENFRAEIARAVDQGLREWTRSQQFPVRNQTRSAILEGFYGCEKQLHTLLDQRRLSAQDAHDYLLFLVGSYMDDLQDRKLDRMKGGFFTRLLQLFGHSPMPPVIYNAQDGQQVSTASPEPSDVAEFSPFRWLKEVWRALTRDSVRLEIQSLPDKAKIELDGKSDPDLITNARRKVWPGPHQLKVVNAAPPFSCDKKVVVPINGSGCYVCRPGQSFEECP
jgi:hypothetical protein